MRSNNKINGTLLATKGNASLSYDNKYEFEYFKSEYLWRRARRHIRLNNWRPILWKIEAIYSINGIYLINSIYLINGIYLIHSIYLIHGIYIIHGNTLYMVYTLNMVYTLYMAYTLYVVYTLYMVKVHALNVKKIWWL